MRKFCVLFLSCLFIFSGGLSARTVVGLKPYRISPGEQLRFFVVSDQDIISKGEAVFSTGRRVSIENDSASLQSSSYVIPSTHPLGTFSVDISYLENDKPVTQKLTYVVRPLQTKLDKVASYEDLRTLVSVDAMASFVRVDALYASHQKVVAEYEKLSLEKNALIEQKAEESLVSEVRNRIVSNAENAKQKRQELMTILRQYTQQQETLLAKFEFIDVIQKDTINRLTLIGKEKRDGVLSTENYKTVSLDVLNKLSDTRVALKEELRQSILKWIDHDVRLSEEELKQISNPDVLSLQSNPEPMQELLEKKAQQLNLERTSLKQYNEELQRRIKHIQTPRYDYALSPSLGIRVFKSDSSFDEGKSAGISVIRFIKERYGVQAGLGVLTATRYGVLNTPERVQYTTYRLGGIYDLNPGQRGRFVVLTGFEGDVQSEILPLSMYIGGGFKYSVYPDVVSKIELTAGSHFAAVFGFEKHLGKRTLPDSGLSSSEMAMFESLVGTDFAMIRSDIPSQRTYYGIQKKSFPDVELHWGREAIERSASLGMMKGREKNGSVVFEPNAFVTRSDAAEMLVKAIYINDLMAEQKTPIRLTIAGDPRRPFFLTVHVTQKQKGLVKEIVTDVPVFAGSMTYEWDGTDLEGKKVPPGTYVITGILSVRDLALSGKSTSGIEKKVVDSFTNTVDVVPSDVPVFQSDSKYAISDLNGLSSVYISEALKLKLFEKIGVSTPQDSVTPIVFSPSKPMSRMEFIVAASAVLRELGAILPKANVDYSAYEDGLSIQNDLKGYISSYVLELGYGGDELKRIRLKDKITRAEAATILDRLVDWQTPNLQL